MSQTSTITFGQAERDAAARLIDLALAEDLGDRGDITTKLMIPPTASGTVHLVARQSGRISGLPIMALVFAQVDPRVTIRERTHDGALLTPGERVATLNGPTASLLTGERTALNFLTHLSGIATLTQRFVEAAAGGKAVILDTRKTLPGWRVLQKYAVRCGGGTNHRLGLYDGILIKDNHLAARYGTRTGQPPVSESSRSFQVRPLSIAVEEARARAPAGMRIEIEVDSLEQLQDALHARPDIILLDNFTPERLREAVAVRDQQSRETLLEASGGVNLDTIARIAATGVDRISIGALTHSAPVLDLAFDWESAR